MRKTMAYMLLLGSALTAMAGNQATPPTPFSDLDTTVTSDRQLIQTTPPPATSSATHAFQASLFPDVSTCPQSDVINGITLSLWGANEQHALSFGLINGSFGHSGGLSIGAVNYTQYYTGLHLGFLNLSTADFIGWQVGGLNYTMDNCSGLQLGFINYAGRMSGVQIGFLNMAPQMNTGLQIGALNLITENRVWFSGTPDQLAPIMVLINWRL